jgi:hypothetical protein
VTGAAIPDDLSPYAGGATNGKSGGGRSTKTPTPGSAAHADLSVAPYAQAAGNQARDESAKQVGDRNTNRGVRGGTVDTGRFTDESSLQVPGSCEPYAGTSNTSATREDASGE